MPSHTRLTRLLDRLLGPRCGACYERHRDLATHQLTEHTDVELMQHGAQRPCRGRNTNVCVAEGCYGEACIREESRR